jgi:NACHT/LRR/PYD domain-containing protein 3
MNDIQGEVAMEQLKYAIQHSKLKELNMSYNAIGDSGVKILATALNSICSLENLNLTSCDFTASGAFTLFQHLAKNSKLREITLDKNHLDGKKLRILRDCISNNNGLSSLSMNGCRLGDEGLYFIALGLIKNRKLRSLSVHSNNF